MISALPPRALRNSTELELAVGDALGRHPGPTAADPALAYLGTKSGSRASCSRAPASHTRSASSG